MSFFGVLVFVTIGASLLWFGYTLFVSIGIPSLAGVSRQRKKAISRQGIPGESQICPVCSARLREGELVSSAAFPSLNGGKDRFMHIKGCLYCLPSARGSGDRSRVCPVCGIILKSNEILIARLFERPGRKAHVHVLGCTRCRSIHR